VPLYASVPWGETELTAVPLTRPAFLLHSVFPQSSRKRRTLVVRIFPNADSCLRLVRALVVEIDEHWVEATRYLNMKDLEEHKKERMRKIEQAA
jgi:hypothetical protein